MAKRGTTIGAAGAALGPLLWLLRLVCDMKDAWSLGLEISGGCIFFGSVLFLLHRGGILFPKDDAKGVTALPEGVDVKDAVGVHPFIPDPRVESLTEERNRAVTNYGNIARGLKRATTALANERDRAVAAEGKIVELERRLEVDVAQRPLWQKQIADANAARVEAEEKLAAGVTKARHSWEQDVIRIVNEHLAYARERVQRRAPGDVGFLEWSVGVMEALAYWLRPSGCAKLQETIDNCLLDPPTSLERIYSDRELDQWEQVVRLLPMAVTKLAPGDYDTPGAN